MARERLECQCGGPLHRPLPRNCPHCGALIAGVRRRLWSLILPVLVVGSLFGLLVLYLQWLL